MFRRNRARIVFGCAPRARQSASFNLVLQAGDNVALAVHHRLEACFGDVGGAVLFGLSNLGVAEAGAVEELGFGRARH
jgi:hypothetical protein